MARKAISPGHQKFTSVTSGFEDKKSNHALSVLATNRLTMKQPNNEIKARRLLARQGSWRQENFIK
jgi:hypothetical protein